MNDPDFEKDLYATLGMPPPSPSMPLPVATVIEAPDPTTLSRKSNFVTPEWARSLRESVVHVPPVPATPPIRRSKMVPSQPVSSVPTAKEKTNTSTTITRTDSKQFMNSLWEDEDEDLDRLIRTTGILRFYYAHYHCRMGM